MVLWGLLATHGDATRIRQPTNGEVNDQQSDWRCFWRVAACIRQRRHAERRRAERKQQEALPGISAEPRRIRGRAWFRAIGGRAVPSLFAGSFWQGQRAPRQRKAVPRTADARPDPAERPGLRRRAGLQEIDRGAELREQAKIHRRDG